ncbi:c-type cytochrome [Planctomycetota bacterium]
MIRRVVPSQNGEALTQRTVAILIMTGVAWLAPSQGASLKPSGKYLFEQNCMACHGVDGTGAPSSTVGFAVPLPDFTDSSFASREPAADWVKVAQEGGPARGFSEIMPAFGDALTEEELLAAVEYISTFYGDKNWPRGELNLPKALVTTKAFPEDELVLTSSYRPEGDAKLSNKLIYERRIGPLNQVELIVPFGWAEQPISGTSDTQWQSSMGDVGIAYKRVMLHSMKSGSILSLGGELFLPTGDKEKGFGADTTVFEPYVSYGQILPSDHFLQAQAGLVWPYDSKKKNEKAFWRGVVGRTFFSGVYGRAWSPMIELLGSKELVSSARTEWDVVPQLQVTLSTRQHVRLAVGARIPMNDTDTRKPEYMIYLLWDWFDGGFFEGW